MSAGTLRLRKEGKLADVVEGAKPGKDEAPEQQTDKPAPKKAAARKKAE